jgi:hypothetical protein
VLCHHFANLPAKCFVEFGVKPFDGESQIGEAVNSCWCRSRELRNLPHWLAETELRAQLGEKAVDMRSTSRHQRSRRTIIPLELQSRSRSTLQ